MFWSCVVQTGVRMHRGINRWVVQNLFARQGREPFHDMPSRLNLAQCNFKLNLCGANRHKILEKALEPCASY